jgi:hypothetical protein
MMMFLRFRVVALRKAVPGRPSKRRGQSLPAFRSSTMRLLIATNLAMGGLATGSGTTMPRLTQTRSYVWDVALVIRVARLDRKLRSCGGNGRRGAPCGGFRAPSRAFGGGSRRRGRVLPSDGLRFGRRGHRGRGGRCGGYRGELTRSRRRSGRRWHDASGRAFALAGERPRECDQAEHESDRERRSRPRARAWARNVGR